MTRWDQCNFDDSTMSTPITERHLHQGDVSLSGSLALKPSGSIEVMRLTRMVRKAQDVLRFVGVPASSRCSVRELEVSFVQGDVPAPGFDPVTGLLRLFYTHRERHEVEQVLTSKRSRYCYFWHSMDGKQRHAWLLSSPR